MLPSDPWDQGSTGRQSTPSREARAGTAPPISIDHLAVLLSPQHEGTPDDLARDLQLNHIVEQACLATGATGAAIALVRGEDLICRASTGSTAPDLGVRLNIEQGLSAYCVHTREAQCCDDSDVDPRVDAEACQRLGVRSVLVLPMIYGDFLLGIFEIFSPHAFAFSQRDEQTMMALSRSVFAALGIDAVEAARQPVEEPALPPPQPLPPQRLHFSDLLAAEQGQLDRSVEESIALVAARLRKETPYTNIAEGPVPANAAEAPPVRQVDRLEPVQSVPVADFQAQPPAVQSAPRDYWTGILTFLVIVLALFLGWMLGHGHIARRNAAQEELLSASQPANSGDAAPADNAVQGEPNLHLPSASPPRAAREEKKTAPNGLVVYQDGKIIYRLNDEKASKKKPLESASVTPVELAPEVAGTLLARRVEPHYPERARLQNVQGAVILQALINEDGGVKQLKVLVGNADLAMAAIDAVRRWRFKSYAPKGKATPFETRITVNFALPGARAIND